MKNFTKTTAIILMGVMYITTNAQSVMIKGGYNHSSLSMENLDDWNYSEQNANGSLEGKVEGENLGGYHIGAVADIPIGKQLSIETGLMIATRGSKLVYTETEVYSDPFTSYSETYEFTQTNSYTYLEIPVSVKVRFPLSGNVNIYTRAGAYAGVGMTGKIIYEDDLFFEDLQLVEPIDWEGENRFDVGATIGAGIEVGSWLLGASYDFGFMEMPYEGWRSCNLKLTLGYTIYSFK